MIIDFGQIRNHYTVINVLCVLFKVLNNNNNPQYSTFSYFWFTIIYCCEPTSWITVKSYFPRLTSNSWCKWEVPLEKDNIKFLVYFVTQEHVLDPGSFSYKINLSLSCSLKNVIRLPFSSCKMVLRTFPPIFCLGDEHIDTHEYLWLYFIVSRIILD